MSSAGPNFPLFPRLPTELQRAIWRECLPWRVIELDVATPGFVYDVDEAAEAPCVSWHTAIVNASPPVIARFCRESRSVAFEKAGPPLA
jgi:hypothetical protein